MIKVKKNWLLKPGFIIIFLSWLLPLFTFAQVPKAYEMVRYAGRLNGKTVRLNLADGYISYSRIILTARNHSQQIKFEPDNSDPDENGHLNFITNIPGRGDHFMLDSIQGVYDNEHPTFINGHYYSAGRVWVVKLRLKSGVDRISSKR